MKTNSKNIDRLVDGFIQVLDDDILNIQLSLIRLDELRAAVIKREDAGLEALVETLKIQGEDYQKVQTRRTEYCKFFAEVLDKPVNEINLTFLMRYVPSAKRKLIEQRQSQLEELVGKMKIEYAATAMLLKEFSRINKMLLRGIVRPNNEGMVYNAKGKSQFDMNKSVISCRF